MEIYAPAGDREEVLANQTELRHWKERKGLALPSTNSWHHPQHECDETIQAKHSIPPQSLAPWRIAQNRDPQGVRPEADPASELRRPPLLDY